jgi:hypothetical protein
MTRNVSLINNWLNIFVYLAFQGNMTAAQESIWVPMTHPPLKWQSSVYRLSNLKKKHFMIDNIEWIVKSNQVQSRFPLENLFRLDRQKVSLSFFCKSSLFRKKILVDRKDDITIFFCLNLLLISSLDTDLDIFITFVSLKLVLE